MTGPDGLGPRTIAALYVEIGVVERLCKRLAPKGGAGCLAWTGYRNPKGYGTINIGGSPRYTHRVAWEAEHGPIPDGLCILHQCDNSSCCNPDHMRLGTKAENNEEMQIRGRARRGAAQAAQTHCKHGHPFSDENTRYQAGKRVCRTCAKEWVRRARSERRVA